MGWGGSINYYLQFHNVSHKGDDKYLLVMAHDALFIRLSIESIAQLFCADSRTLFVSPSYLSPRINSYNILKSYHSRPGASFGRVIIAQQTAFLQIKNFFQCCVMTKNFGYMAVNMKFS